MGENGSGKSTLLQALAHKCRIHIWQEKEGARFDINPWERMLYRYIDIQWANGTMQGSYFDSEISRDFARHLDEWAAADPGLLAYFGGIINRLLVVRVHYRV